MLKMEYRFKKKEKLLWKKLAQKGIDYSFPSLVNTLFWFSWVSLRGELPASLVVAHVCEYTESVPVLLTH